MKYLKYLFIFIPISFLLEFMHMAPLWIFITACLSIIPLAGLMGEATEEIAIYSGPKVGGLLNATFGNATELIISIFALKAGLFEVVKASLAGAVIGNILLVMGASMLVGGAKFKIQTFNKKAVGISSSMLLFAVIGLSIPAIFTHTVRPELLNTQYEGLSIAVAIIMFAIYILSIFFSFFTHKDVFGTDHEEVSEGKWSFNKAIGVLVLSTIFIAVESEFLVGSIESVTETFGLSQLFVGIIIIAIIGNAAEHSTAIIMAAKNKMDISVEIAIGSSLQIILFVLPVLVFISLFFTPMSIVFNDFELFAMFFAAIIANQVAGDGESNWLEGVQLIAVYVIIAISFFFI